MKVASEVPVPVFYRRKLVGEFFADLTVNDCVLLELKSVSALDRDHNAQVMNYLRATRFEVELLRNFGPRAHFKRFVFENDRKAIRVDPIVSAVDFSGGEG